MAPKVGFIGLGWMGKGMSKCIVRGGFDTIVYDVMPEPVKELVKDGAKAASSVAELAKNSEVVVVIVRSEAQVEDVVAGASGLLDNLASGSTVIVMSTVSPKLVQRLGAEAQKKGISLLDAPVTGQKREEGELTIMVGGDEVVFQKYLPVLDTMGKNVLYMGELGAGEVTKIVNNAIASMNLFAASEALALGVKAGVSLEKLLQQLSPPESAGNSFMIANWAVMTQMKQIFKDTGAGPLELMSKDLPLALDLANEVGMPMPVCSLVDELGPNNMPD